MTADQKLKQATLVWKPLDVGPLRLYRVRARFVPSGNEYSEWVIAAKGPRFALSVVSHIYAHPDLVFDVETLRVLQPEK